MHPVKSAGRCVFLWCHPLCLVCEGPESKPFTWFAAKKWELWRTNSCNQLSKGFRGVVYLFIHIFVWSKDYPWISTRAGACKCFEYVRTHGFLKFMSKRRIIVGNDKKPVQQAGAAGECPCGWKSVRKPSCRRVIWVDWGFGLLHGEMWYVVGDVAIIYAASGWFASLQARGIGLSHDTVLQSCSAKRLSLHFPSNGCCGMLWWWHAKTWWELRVWFGARFFGARFQPSDLSGSLGPSGSSTRHDERSEELRRAESPPRLADVDRKSDQAWAVAAFGLSA